MGSVERRQRERENLRRGILDAACNLFATGNFKDVSIRKIAEAVEYSPAAIYLHFKDKDEILDTLAEEGFTLLSEQLESITAADPLERLREGGRAYIRFALTRPHYFRIMFELGDSFDTLSGSYQAKQVMSVRAYAFIAAAVHDAMALGLFDRAHDELIVGHAIWAHIHGGASLGLAGRLGILPDDRRDEFFDACVDTAIGAFLRSPGR
jgi:AcrR family transcriptional regulator